MESSSKITIWICDDEEADRIRLAELCRAYEKSRMLSFVMRMYDGADALLRAEERTKIDILFLDIEMEKSTSGIDVKDSLFAERNEALIIYTTSHVELAPETHGRNVCGFLVKPVEEERFAKKLDEVIALVTEDSLVSYLQADGAYIITHYADGRTEIKAGTLSSELEKLDAGCYVRCHRSFAVNMAHVDSLDIAGRRLIMDGGNAVPVARRELDNVKGAYGRFLSRRFTRRMG